MIKKLITIKNIGKFRSFTSKGDLQFRKLNLIYAENGRGKTTLSQIFRSLQDQDDSIINGRKTVGGSGEPTIEILFDTKKISFRNGKWDARLDSEMEIFDATFVNQNVFSGQIVEHDQKKQLYLFTIGKEGVALAESLVSEDEEIKKTNNAIKESSKKLLTGVDGVLNEDDFIKLPPKENIDQQIVLLEKSLASVEGQAEIKVKSPLAQLNLPMPDLTSFLAPIFSDTTSTAANEAVQRTKKYIHERLDHDGEHWLEYGVGKIADDKCPFCEQSINDVDLVDAFRTYFSEEYKTKLKSIHQIGNKFSTTFSSKELLNLSSTYSNNIEMFSFWKQYIAAETPPSIDLNKITNIWSELTEFVQQAIAQKLRSPFEQLELSSALRASIDDYKTALQSLDIYNTSVSSINRLISEKKQSIEGLHVQDLKTSLSRMRNTKLRYTSEKEKLIQEYSGLVAHLQTLRKSKESTRKRLNQYTEKIFKKYEDAINRHLANCGASFRVADYKASFAGGKPSSNFTLMINNMPVDLGTDRSPLTIPTFKNTLSDGDKSSLAFAFFLAKLESDPEIGHKIVVFDDPISSLDNHRKNYTADQILKSVHNAKQVVVLTHDSYFARLVWGKWADKSTLLTQLCIKRDNVSDSTIEAWDIERETRSDYYQTYFTLADYLEGKSSLNLRAIAMCIRPLLEGNLRIRFPRHFSSNQWLGDFINSVRNADSEPLIRMQDHLEELEHINDFSKQFHHDTNPFADSATINDTELSSYVSRTLTVIRGVHNAV